MVNHLTKENGGGGILILAASAVNTLKKICLIYFIFTILLVSKTLPSTSE